MATLLTSAEAAARLGVGVTAIKRWSDAGVLPCVKTAGGHRRFHERDVNRIARSGLSETGQQEWRSWIDALLHLNDIHAVLSLLFAERSRRGSWVDVATHVGALLEAIGDQWACGQLSVAEEHVASSVLQRALTLVTETIPVPPTAPRCLLAPAEGEEHTLGLSLAELCLREAGWRSEWMGGHTRVVDICERIAGSDLQLVALSASAAMIDKRALRGQIRAIGAACERSSVPLVAGGSGEWPDHPPFGTRLTRWEDFARLVRTQSNRAPSTMPAQQLS